MANIQGICNATYVQRNHIGGRIRPSLLFKMTCKYQVSLLAVSVVPLISVAGSDLLSLDPSWTFRADCWQHRSFVMLFKLTVRGQ